MQIFSITDHSIICKNKHYKHESYFCFQFNYKFYMVIYCSCWDYDHLSFKNDLIRKAGKKYKLDKYKEDDINRSVDIKKLINKNELDFLLSRDISEVCYCYSDNAGKEYCISNLVSFTDWTLEQINYLDNCRLAIETIHKMNICDSFKDQLKSQIYKLNGFNNSNYDHLSHIDKVKLTKFFLKHIKL